MAEIFLSHVVTEILKKLQSVVTETVTGAWGLKGDLKKLSESAARLQSLLKRVQYVQAVEDDESIKRWLEKLQEVVYKAVDVVDEFQYEILRCKVEMKGKVREFFSGNNHVLFRVKMASKVKEVNESLAVMEKETPGVLLTMIVPTIAAVGDRRCVCLDSLPDRRTDSFLGQRPIGRTKEAERIIQMLQVISTDAPLFTVISIVGFGGLGKTTLAQLVFEEAKKKNLFDEMMWVCVSEPFDAQKILGEMLEKLDATTGGLRNIDVIVSKLQHHLNDKRFLLVLDDVWNKESATWNTLKTRLEIICGKSGNFVIATTRGSDVAGIMQSKHVEKLKQLSNTECWNIIKEKLVGISREMEAIGMKIANQCGGVPLAAKVIGGVLSSRSNKTEWLSILDNDVWNEVDEDKRVLGVLKLSFDHLPQPQRLCFAYCSLFPKDVVFVKTQLIQLWMAEDFLNTSSTNEGTRAKLMEDVGDEYFHNLYANSFFQDAQRDDLGNIVRCKMHDLLHDLASSVSKSQRLHCGSNCCETSGGCRLSFSCGQVSKVEEILKQSEEKTKKLRCLFCRVDISSVLSNFRRLRSLDMSDAKLKDLPDAIGKLKHLRYLDVSKNETIEELPESITKLYNLQTLRVFQCKSLKELPSKIRNLVSLRHMGIDDKRLLPSEVGCLTNLQTLPFFVVGVEKGQKIDELEGLKNLTGKMVICGLENVRDKVEAEKARVKEKKLSRLVLQWMDIVENEVENFSSYEERRHEEVMGGLQAPTNTQTLNVMWYMGKQFPQWMSELNKLVELRLENCRKCVRMPTLGHLPNLKVLHVEKMDGVKSIGTEFYGDMDTLFPSLEVFTMSKMKSLVEWATPNGSELFPKLRVLLITYCPYLESCPVSQLISSPIYLHLRSFGLIARLEILCNFTSLKKLFIGKCPKLTFPQIGLTSLLDFDIRVISEELLKKISVSSEELGESWKLLRLEGCVERIREFPKSLEALEIERFYDDLSLEAFHALLYLKHLVIRDCPGLVSIPNLSSLISLEHLEIGECGLVKSIPTLSSLTSLNHLEIESCSHLESIPNVLSLKILKELHISSCNNLSRVPDGLISCQSLEKLVIDECGKLTELWSDSCPSFTCLEELSISLCGNLRSLTSDIKSFTSLKKLKVAFCRKMASIDDDIFGFLEQLKELEWGSFFGELDELPGLNSMHLLTSLEKVTLTGWSKLKSLPHQLQHLTSISYLEIRDFDGVESLPDWLCNLSSLQTLKITQCMNLKNLPADMQLLSKLTTLNIYHCPLLKIRYAKDVGPGRRNAEISN